MVGNPAPKYHRLYVCLCDNYVRKANDNLKETESLELYSLKFKHVTVIRIKFPVSCFDE